MRDQPAEKSGPHARAVPGWFLGIVTVPIILGLVWYGRNFLIPLVIAALLIILINALVSRAASVRIFGWRPPRWIASIIGAAVVLLTFVLIGIAVSNQVAEIAATGPEYASRAKAKFETIEAWLGPEIVSSINGMIAKLDVGEWLSAFLQSASGVLGTITLVLLYVGFMMVERGAFWKKLPQIFSSDARAARVSSMLVSISRSVQEYMWINAVTSAMSAVVSYVVLRVVGVDFAVTLALLVFLLNFIPNIGSILATVLQGVVTLLQFDTITPFLVVVICYGGADAIIGNVIQPALLGKSLNLSSFMVMVALTFWGTMWGAIGAFLAVPMMVVTMIICAEIPALRGFAVILSGDGKLSRTGDGDPAGITQASGPDS